MHVDSQGLPVDGSICTELLWPATAKGIAEEI